MQLCTTTTKVSFVFDLTLYMLLIFLNIPLVGLHLRPVLAQEEVATYVDVVHS
jgi:hypothetical protein